jgi:hypothetical protein
MADGDEAFVTGRVRRRPPLLASIDRSGPCRHTAKTIISSLLPKYSYNPAGCNQSALRWHEWLIGWLITRLLMLVRLGSFKRFVAMSSSATARSTLRSLAVWTVLSTSARRRWSGFSLPYGAALVRTDSPPPTGTLSSVTFDTPGSG